MCLTIDCSGIYPDKLNRFSTDVENTVCRTCYFNVGNNDQNFNVVISRRINDEKDDNDFYFKIEPVRSKTNSKTFQCKI